MELLLWRWSTAVQVTSVLMMTVFFAVLARSVGRPELRWWVRAWATNLGAIALTLAFWYVPPTRLSLALLGGLYLAAKTTFLLLLINGAWALWRPGPVPWPPRRAVAFVAGYSVLAAATLTSVERMGIVQHTVIGVLLGAAGVVLARRAPGGMLWLAAGFVIRALLSFAETAAYALRLAPDGAVPPALLERVGMFLSASSSFDSGAEWLLALGCVLALSERIQRELRDSNRDLLAAQEDLRRLADRDPLTGLINRRSLRDVFTLVQPKGATLLFFDLDGFKEINDRYGHQAGDECLVRFAGALRECFRPADALVRYAGDEFLVVTSGLDRAAALQRVETLRERLRKSAGGGPEIAFSVGVHDLAPGGQPEAALRGADEAMYRAKAGGRSGALQGAGGREARGAG